MKHRNETHEPRHRIASALALAAALGTGAAAGVAQAAIEPNALVGAPVTVVEPAAGDNVFFDVFFTGNISLAVDADGDAIVVWVTEEADEDWTLHFRRINADGSAGPATLVREAAAADGLELIPVDVAMDADGDAVIAWIEDGATGLARAQRVAADGSLLGEPFTVSGAGQDAAEVAAGMDAAGNFVIAWIDEDTSNAYYRRYDVLGTPQNGPDTPLNQALPVLGNLALAVGPKGDFAATWESEVDLIARVWPASGEPLDEFVALPVIGLGGTFDSKPVVDADGSFAVAIALLYAADDGGELRFYHAAGAQRFAADGTPGPGDFLAEPVEVPVPLPLLLTGAALDVSGDVTAAWTNLDFEAERVTLSVARMNGTGAVEDAPIEFDAGECGESEECRFPLVMAMDVDGDVLLLAAALENESISLELQRFKGPEESDLAIALEADPADANPGDDVVLTLIVENLHPLSDHYGIAALDAAVGAVHGVEVELTFPEDIEFGEPDGEGWSCESLTAASARCVYSGVLSAAGEATLKTTVTVPADAEGTYEMTATVVSQSIDPDTDNNATTLSVTITPPSSGGNPGSSRGGGGAFGWLALLAMAAGLRRRTIRGRR